MSHDISDAQISCTKVCRKSKMLEIKKSIESGHCCFERLSIAYAVKIADKIFQEPVCTVLHRKSTCLSYQSIHIHRYRNHSRNCWLKLSNWCEVLYLVGVAKWAMSIESFHVMHSITMKHSLMPGLLKLLRPKQWRNDWLRYPHYAGGETAFLKPRVTAKFLSDNMLRCYFLHYTYRMGRKQNLSNSCRKPCSIRSVISKEFGIGRFLLTK